MIDGPNKADRKLLLTSIHISELVRRIFKHSHNRLIKLNYKRLYHLICIVFSGRIKQCHHQHIEFPVFFKKITKSICQTIQDFSDILIFFHGFLYQSPEYIKLCIHKCPEQSKLTSKVIIKSRFRNTCTVNNFLDANSIITLFIE